MTEPSDRERAELPECSRQYMEDLEMRETSLLAQLTEVERSRQVYSGDAARADAKLGVIEDDLAELRYEIDQTLGKALCYPAYPISTDVCTGEHTVVTLAHEAADRLRGLKRENDRLLRDYSLFEEVSPPDVPRAKFVKWCFDAWEEKCEREQRQRNKKLPHRIMAIDSPPGTKVRFAYPDSGGT